MRPSHLAAIPPLCPVCRQAGARRVLAPHATLRARGEQVVEGILFCAGCGREYPVLDGVPLLLRQLRRYVNDSLFQLVLRQDLSPTLASLLGDCCGPDSAWDLTHRHASSYCWDHWAEFDPEEAHLPPPGSLGRIASKALGALPALPEGPILDLGCAAGRAAFEAAGRFPGRLVVGIDMNFDLLARGQRLLRGGRMAYPRRREGLIHEPRDFVVPLQGEAVDLWCADVHELPFDDGVFAAGLAFNLLDSVADPAAVLAELCRVVRGPLALSVAFDWAAHATPVERWLGGHSQRTPHRGAGLEGLRQAIAAQGREILAQEDAAWTLRLHERASTQYRVWVGVVGVGGVGVTQ
ncbi:MAG: methyltransferase domain-containing protein [Pseudomonadota bacterium]